MLNIASRAPQIRSPSNFANGRSRATLPVATSTFSPTIVCIVFPGVAGADVNSSFTTHSCTSTFHAPALPPPSLLPTIFPFPTKCVILFFFNKNAIPLVSFPATSRLRPITRSQSSPTFPSIFNPQNFWSSAALIFSTSSALASNALLGMHPQFRHTPPSLARSTTATLMPSCAARIAPT